MSVRGFNIILVWLDDMKFIYFYLGSEQASTFNAIQSYQTIILHLVDRSIDRLSGLWKQEG